MAGTPPNFEKNFLRFLFDTSQRIFRHSLLSGIMMFDDLPFDIRYLVFDLLSLKDLLVAEQVSKLWRHLLLSGKLGWIPSKYQNLTLEQPRRTLAWQELEGVVSVNGQHVKKGYLAEAVLWYVGRTAVKGLEIANIAVQVHTSDDTCKAIEKRFLHFEDQIHLKTLKVSLASNVLMGKRKRKMVNRYAKLAQDLIVRSVDTLHTICLQNCLSSRQEVELQKCQGSISPSTVN